MCAPLLVAGLTTLGGGSAIAGAATAAGLAGSALSAKSAIDQGNYQKGVSRYNTQVARNKAQEVRNQGNEAEVKRREQTNQLLSQQRARLGASGVDMDSGSALALQEDTTRIGESDALRIRSNYDSQVNALTTGAELTQGQGDLAQRAGFNTAARSLIEGGSTFASKFYDNKKAKV